MAVGPTYHPDGTTGQFVPEEVDDAAAVGAVVTALKALGIFVDPA